MVLLHRLDAPGMFGLGGKRAGGRKARGSSQNYIFLLLIFVLVALSYWATPMLVTRRGSAPRPGAMGKGEAGRPDRTWSDSAVTIQHVAPSSWTSDDVGTWLASIDLEVLRPAFKRNGVNGAVLLELTRHAIQKDLAIDNETMTKRLEQEIKVLKHRVSMARRWGADNRARSDDKAPSRGVYGGSEPLAEIKIYRVGDSMFTDKDGNAVEDGVEPAATLHRASFLQLRDLISMASEELGRPVREFVAHNGDLVTSMQELPPQVFALCEHDFFVLPTEHNGFVNKVTLEAEGKEATVVTLSRAPRVFRIEKFLTMAEASKIRSLAEDRMEPSTVAEEGDKALNGVTPVRTSSTAWLKEGNDETVAMIRQRVADLIKVPMHLAEDMQVLHYAKGQHYHSHHDYFDPHIYRGFIKAPGANRFITVFFFLSDVEEGGETVFPFAGDDRPVTNFGDCSRGLRVKPKKGDAIVFYSLLAHNHMEACPDDTKGCNLDVRSLHGGCDVIRGDKWAANYWVSNK